MQPSDENLKTIEIDLEDFSKEVLIWLILESEKYNITISQIIVKIISEALTKHSPEKTNQLPFPL